MKKTLKIIGGIFGIILIFFAVSIHLTGNFYQVADGVYRSGQLYRYNLPYYLKKHKIKTVVNLTQGSLRDPDYINELEIADNLQVKVVNYKMLAGQYLTVKQSKALINILKTAEKPILIHCFGGADRTSLAAALYVYEISGLSSEVAKQQFSGVYGHLPSIRPHVIAMDKSFTDYVANRQSR